MEGDAEDRWAALANWHRPTVEEPLRYRENWLRDRLAAVRWPLPHEHKSPGQDRVIHRRRRRLVKWVNEVYEAGELPIHVAYFMIASTIEHIQEARFEVVLASDYRVRQDAWALEHGYNLSEDPWGWEELRDEPEWAIFEVEWERLRQETWEATFREHADPHMAQLAIDDLEQHDRYREYGRQRLFGDLPSMDRLLGLDDG